MELYAPHIIQQQAHLMEVCTALIQPSLFKGVIIAKRPVAKLGLAMERHERPHSLPCLQVMEARNVRFLPKWRNHVLTVLQQAKLLGLATALFE
jgi:hypothetical protein